MDLLIVGNHQLCSAGLRVLIKELPPQASVSTANRVLDALNRYQTFNLILLDLQWPENVFLHGWLVLPPPVPGPTGC